jgi:hypothetical protein
VLYLTHFYYRQKPYVLGVRNASDVIIRNTKVRCEPEGEYGCGVLSPGNAKFQMDPPWPVPQAILVTFQDEGGVTRSLATPTKLRKDFRGKIVVVIVRTNSEFCAVVSSEYAAE